jgi:hypothetical protein
MAAIPVEQKRHEATVTSIYRLVAHKAIRRKRQKSALGEAAMTEAQFRKT